jgi:hypothetical protein
MLRMAQNQGKEIVWSKEHLHVVSRKSVTEFGSIKGEDI